ncbi:MAG: hypothetical protein JWO08_601 [Verrucomicrobiaceae bacterium]|nr:hypothetical protein [Verrucomicrobiaceae bacterium]
MTAHSKEAAETMKREGLLSRAEHWLRAKSTWTLLGIFIPVSIVVGWIDFVTTWEVNLSLIYALIAGFVGWLGGRRAGIIMAFVNTTIPLIANQGSTPYQTALGYAWFNVSRLLFLTVIAIGASMIRKRRDEDADRIQMLEEMRQLEMEIVSASEHEQQRIGQDLHDGLCQQLAAIGCAVRALSDDLTAGQRPEASDAAKIEEALQQTVMEARSMARGIFPVHVDSSGLSAALEEMAQMTQRLTGVPIHVTDSAEVHIADPEVSMHLYRIAQEAVANSVRHSGAQQVVLSLLSNGKQIELRVDDNGRGIPRDLNGRSTGMGLRTMRYRAHALGADLDIEPRAGGGTSMCCRLPIPTSVNTNSHGKK